LFERTDGEYLLQEGKKKQTNTGKVNKRMMKIARRRRMEKKENCDRT
jgi:hypothetical protein